MTVSEKLSDIFRMVFDAPDLVVRPEMTAGDVEGWDSLSHVNLIVAIEAGFSIKFTQKELLSFKNVGDLVTATEAKVAARA
jgi:acyl carrier protein